jgi:lambda family phage minor tail protein L
MSISTDIQKLEPGAIIELFEVDLTPFGGDLLRFHAGTNQLTQDIVWQGETYVAFPIRATGFEFSGQGQSPRPKMLVSNVFGSITALVLQYDDIVGAKVSRKRTLSKYLDAVNFPGGVNLTADPTAEFPTDVFYVDRKATESNDFVEFELAPAMDVTGVMLPRRQIVQNICPWKYRGAECGYTGTAYFNTSDQPTSQANDACGKRLTSCKLRFGEFAELPYGGFPAAGLIR